MKISCLYDTSDIKSKMCPKRGLSLRIKKTKLFFKIKPIQSVFYIQNEYSRNHHKKMIAGSIMLVSAIKIKITTETGMILSTTYLMLMPTTNNFYKTKIDSEIDMLNKLAEQPDAIRLLESYKNNMRFKRDWNGIAGIDCLIIIKYIEQLIDVKKHSISISDMR